MFHTKTNVVNAKFCPIINKSSSAKWVSPQVWIVFITFLTFGIGMNGLNSWILFGPDISHDWKPELCRRLLSQIKSKSELQQATCACCASNSVLWGLDLVLVIYFVNHSPPLGQGRILSFERGGFGSHYMEESFWKRLWTCRQTEYWIIIIIILQAIIAIPSESTWVTALILQSGSKYTSKFLLKFQLSTHSVRWMNCAPHKTSRFFAAFSKAITANQPQQLLLLQSSAMRVSSTPLLFTAQK